MGRRFEINEPGSAINLARLKALGRIKPAISLKHLIPVPITLAPALPTGPVKPIPIVTHLPAVGPRRVVPKAMAPSKILEHLNRVSVLSKPKIPIESLKQIAKSSPERKGPRWIKEPETLERAVKSTEHMIQLKRLKKVARALQKEAPSGWKGPVWIKNPKYLKHLGREVFDKKKRKGKK